MGKRTFKEIMAIKNSYKKQILEIAPNVANFSGIYILTRVDEENKKYAYIGQSIHLLDRLAEHLMGRKQWIDLSIYKHKLYSENNKYGWAINYKEVPENELNEKERNYIEIYQELGYELRNKTAGGQDKGKVGISPNKVKHSFSNGIKQGYEKARKETALLFQKYLIASARNNNKITQRKLKEFNDFIKSGIK